MGSTTQDDSDDEEGDGNDGDASTPSRRPPGRPTLSPEGRMEFEQLKERRRFLTNKYYGQRQEEEKRERLSEKRRAARAQQWENKHDSTKKNFSGSRGWAGHKLTFYRLLPVEESDQEEILARLIGSFPTCGLTSCDTQMHVNHSTTMYRKFTEVNDFLSEKCSDEIAKDASQSQYPPTPDILLPRKKRRTQPPKKKNQMTDGMFSWDNLTLNFDNI